MSSFHWQTFFTGKKNVPLISKMHHITRLRGNLSKTLPPTSSHCHTPTTIQKCVTKQHLVTLLSKTCNHLNIDNVSKQDILLTITLSYTFYVTQIEKSFP